MSNHPTRSRQQSFLFVVAHECGHIDYGFRLPEELMQHFATCMAEVDDVAHRRIVRHLQSAPVREKQADRLRQARAVLHFIKKKRPA